MLSLRERALEEGKARGEVIKTEEVAKNLKELQQLGLDENEILRILTAAYVPSCRLASA